MAFSTKKSLLSRIRVGSEIGWYEFYRTYFPLIMLRGGDFNLTGIEKDELVQEVLIVIFKNSRIFLYDPQKDSGPFVAPERTAPAAVHQMDARLG